MCQKCVDAVKQAWPNQPESDYGTLLWNATCFPAGDAEMVTEQVQKMADWTGCDLGLALALADEMTERAMADAHKK